MRTYGVPQMMDLVADGGNAVALTPGSSEKKAQFLVQAPKAGIADNWPLALNIVKKLSVTIDKGSTGAAPIDWDALASIAASFDSLSPVFGNIHPKDTFTGPITKHLAEFVSSGFTYGDGARTQITGGAGNATADVFFVLPFAHECFERPHHFAPWVGWLKDTKVTTFIAANDVLDDAQTGALLSEVVVSGWVEYVVSEELLIPTINQWHKYEVPAAGGKTAILNGIGTANGLNDVLDGARLGGLYELMAAETAGGLAIMGAGASTADNYTAVNIPQLGQDQFEFVDAFFRAYRVAMGGHRGPIEAAGVTPAIHDRAGNPNSMDLGAAPAATLNTDKALYIPWRSVGRDQQLTKIAKFFGDLKILRQFTNTPASGTYAFVTNEFRELGEGKKKELVGKTGRPARFETIWGPGTKGTADNQRHPKRQATLPQRVVF